MSAMNNLRNQRFFTSQVAGPALCLVLYMSSQKRQCIQCESGIFEAKLDSLTTCETSSAGSLIGFIARFR